MVYLYIVFLFSGYFFIWNMYIFFN